MIENKSPDTILFNGKVYTVDQQRSIASAVAFCGDKILAVGSDSEILPMADKETKVIDLCGKLVLPGLNDSHAHPLWMARQMEFAAFTEARSIQECLDILAKKAAETPVGEWIVVSMTWHETQLQEGRLPTRKEIDSVCPNHPVCIPRGGHLKVLNSKAFEVAGITDDVADPEGGKFGRDADGKLDGMAIDAAADRIDSFLPVVSPELYAKFLEEAGKLLASRGVTTTAELGLLGGPRVAQENSYKTLMNLYDEGKMSVRMAAVLFAVDYDMAKWGVEFGRTLKNSDHFRFQGIKLVTDGGAEGASLRDPYMIIEGLQTNPDFHGVAMWPKSRSEEFKRVMQLCTDEDLMLQVHINGDLSADDTIPLLVEHAKKYDVSKRDWTICHLPFATDEQLDAIKEAKLNVSVQHQPYLLGLNMRRFWGDDRANSQENYRKYIDKGLRMGGGTDYPIGPASPFQSIQFMVDRKIVDGSVMGAESAITLEEAVYLWTKGSADIEGWGDMIGSIEPGKKADIVVLNQDIFTVPTEEIGKTTVASTWLGGKCVFQQ